MLNSFEKRFIQFSANADRTILYLVAVNLFFFFSFFKVMNFMGSLIQYFSPPFRLIRGHIYNKTFNKVSNLCLFS